MTAGTPESKVNKYGKINKKNKFCITEYVDFLKDKL